MNQDNPQTVNQLKANPLNPRSIKKQRFEALKQSLTKFGDLSGIVFNETTGQLVGGHMRTKGIGSLKDAEIIITETLPEPNAVGTVARGFINFNDEKFTYRVVRWDAQFEAAANIAANNISGEFDDDLLANMVASLDEMHQQLTGFDSKEIDNLLQLSSAPESDMDDDGSERMTFKLNPDDVTFVQQALNEARQELGIGSDLSDGANGQALLLLAKHYLANQRQDDNGPDFH